MATEPFTAPPLTMPQLDTQTVVVPDPETLEEQASGPMLMRMVPALIGLVMVSFVVMMVMTGLRVMSPMMLMMPMMAVVGAWATSASARRRRLDERAEHQTQELPTAAA